MPSLYDPKALTDALELDYFQRPRPLHRWSRRCLLLAGCAGMLYSGWVLWPSHHAALQAGPLSSPHSMFSQDCGKCHTDSFATAFRLLPGNSHMVSTPDAACLQCHPAPNHGRQPPGDPRFIKSENCASCHKEHRGPRMLARPSDLHCTQCHAVLKDHYADCKYDNVASFTTHPEFALWTRPPATDPGNVEFSHHQHLQLRAEDLAKLNAPSDSFRATNAALHKLQEMQCAYCHQPDPAGKYMQPIQFDKHCQDCHALRLPAKILQVPPALQPSARAFLTNPIPHPKEKQTAWDVRAVVRERYLKFAQDNGSILQLKPANLDEWMILPGLSPRGEPSNPSQLAWVNEQWKQAESLFFDKGSGCAHCHAEMAKKRFGDDGLPLFTTPSIPTRWLKNSVFNHNSHRMLDCKACHEGAEKSLNRGDVLMPKLASCQSCHKPTTGFARADCVECHRFHTHPVLGAKRGTMTIDDGTGK